MAAALLSLLLLAVFASSIEAQERPYFGKLIGEFPETAVHDVKGTVYAPTDDSLYIQGFHYDGAGPDAFFWAGTTQRPNQNGFIIPDELGRVVKLSPYKNQNVLIKLPDGKKLRDIKWIAVWCRQFGVNFGHVDIPFNLDPPKELNLGRVPNLAHDTSAEAVIIKDIKTLEIKKLRYDGSAPDAFFLVGKGSEPHRFGVKVPDETGSLKKIHGYTGQDITIRLPDNITIFDIDWFGLYCITYRQNFGHVSVPKNRLNVPADLDSLASTVRKRKRKSG
jgi:hypothetical protein